MQIYIRGLLFNIDTLTSNLVCCKQPRCVPNEKIDNAIFHKLK